MGPKSSRRRGSQPPSSDDAFNADRLTRSAARKASYAAAVDSPSQQQPSHSRPGDASADDTWLRLRRESNLSTLSLSPKRPLSALSGGSTIGQQQIGSKRRASGLRGSTTAYDDELSFDTSMERVDEEEQDEWTMIDRMRNWRNDAMTQHLYDTAQFWGSKVFEMTDNPNDAFWLAQTHFLTHQYAAAERILTSLRAPSASLSGSSHRRLIDTSLACRYLAAQCQVRLGRWDEALDMVGRQTNLGVDHALPDEQQNGDGGIKLLASMAHLRGLIHLHQGATELAKEALIEALTRDVKCFESYQTLIGSELLTSDEEWDFTQGLQYRRQLGEDADFVRMMYTIRLRKIKRRPEQAAARDLLTDHYGLGNDPDVLFSQADELYAALRYAECYKLTSRILLRHATHQPTLRIHIACMMQLPSLRSKLFLLAHELVEHEPDDAVTWYAVGCWYFAGKRWDEARKFFGKSVLIDSRFGPAWIAFAHSYAHEGEHDQAITAYSTALRHLQGSHLPLLFIGMQHLGLGGLPVAIEYLSSAKERCADDPLVWNELGVALVKSGRVAEGVTHFTTALTLARRVQQAPTSLVTILLNTGHALRKLDQLVDARRLFLQVLSLDARCAAAYAALGYIDHLEGRYDDAVGRYHDALAISPAEPVTCDLLKFVLEDAAANQVVPGPEAYPGLPRGVLESIDEQVLEMDRDIMLGKEPLLPEELVEDEQLLQQQQQRGARNGLASATAAANDRQRQVGASDLQHDSLIMMEEDDDDDDVHDDDDEDDGDDEAENERVAAPSSESDMMHMTGMDHSIEMDEGSATFDSMQR